jgi:hypothetical protein
MAAPSEAPPQPPGPTIEVTIGRIEIRATVAPAASRRRREPAAPALRSLDDYLRAAGRGGER